MNTVCEWTAQRAATLAAMQDVMGTLPSADRRVPPDVSRLDEERLPGVVRAKISYAAEAGDRVPAWLLIPETRGARAPAVLCLHQTTAIGKGEPAGLGGKPNLHYALELAQRGYVTLAPDYPGYGDYRIDAYARGYVSATMKGIWNHMRAIDLLQSLPRVDPARIACIGHSLGGHNTIFLAAFDLRVAAIVSSCGFNSFPKYRGGDISGWSHNGYMPRIRTVHGADGRRMPFDFPAVIASLAPRPLFVNAPLHDNDFEVEGVQDCLDAARPAYALFGAGESLVAVHPDGGHDFPPDIREQAYRFLDRHLARGAGGERGL